MENLDPKSSAQVPSAQPESPVDQQVESLRQTIISVLVLVIVISGTLNIYLWRQVKYSRSDLAGFRPYATQVITEFEKNAAPQMREFFGLLVDFANSARGDDTLRAILKRYNLPSQPSNTPPGSPSQSPAVPAPAKK